MMTPSVVLLEIGAAILAATGYVYGITELGIAGILLAVVSLLPLFPFAASRPRLFDLLLAIHSGLVAAFALLHRPPILCASALAAAVVGWDVGRTAQLLADADPVDRRRFAASYTVRALAIGGLGIALVAMMQIVRVRLTFGSGLALSLAILVLGTLLLRALHRNGPTKEQKEQEEDPSPQQ